MFSLQDAHATTIAPLPRTARATGGGLGYHVLTPGHTRSPGFPHEGDAAHVVPLMRHALARVALRVLAHGVMPSPLHRAVWPEGDDDRSAGMHWLLTAPVRG